MASNIANTVNFGTTGLNVGDYTYSLYALSAPGYLPMAGPYPQYLKSSYPVLGELMNPSPTPVTYAATARTLAAAISPYGVAYGNGRWIVSRSTGQNAYETSTDNGVTWSTAAYGIGIKIIAYGNGYFMAVQGNTSTVARRSTDGVNWTAISVPANTNNWYDLAYANGIWMLVGYQMTATSTDNGVTWNSVTINPALYSVVYGDGIWVASEWNGGGLVRSANNGLSWSRVVPANNLWSEGKNIAYGNGTFVHVGGEIDTLGNYIQTNKVAVSKDGGLSWVMYTLPATSFWASVTFANGVFVAVAGHMYSIAQSISTTIAATSSDGITWTQRVLPTSAPWQSVGFGNGQFLAVSGDPGTPSTAAATINYAAATTVFSIPAVQTLTGTTAYIKAT